jgi:hypothetical protein
MKHILTLSLCFLALSLSAQTDGWEYPFPYNPDGDADGYVTLSDLLDLLALYGNEYPDSFHYDDSGALLYLGKMHGPDCYNQAQVAEGSWRVLNKKSFYRWFDVITEMLQEEFEVDGQYLGANIILMDHNDDFTSAYLDYRITQSDNMISFFDQEAPNNLSVYSNLYTPSDGISENYCYIVTEVRPEIEYYVSFGSLSQVKEEVNDSLSNGWNLIGGFSNNSFSSCSQAIWRWAE